MSCKMYLEADSALKTIIGTSYCMNMLLQLCKAVAVSMNTHSLTLPHSTSSPNNRSHIVQSTLNEARPVS